MCCRSTPPLLIHPNMPETKWIRFSEEQLRLLCWVCLDSGKNIEGKVSIFPLRLPCLCSSQKHVFRIAYNQKGREGGKKAKLNKKQTCQPEGRPLDSSVKLEIFFSSSTASEGVLAALVFSSLLRLTRSLLKGDKKW